MNIWLPNRTKYPSGLKAMIEARLIDDKVEYFLKCQPGKEIDEIPVSQYNFSTRGYFVDFMNWIFRVYKRDE